MNLPSFNYLLSNAKKSLLRFPLMIASAIMSIILGIYLIENRETIKNFFPFINIILTAALGIPVYFSATVYSLKRKIEKKGQVIIMSITTLLLVAIYFTLPGSDSTHNTSLPYIKYGIYNITAHLIVAIIPFISKGELNSFWHYNKILFIRTWTAVVYSGFLFSGLALAITSLHLLFDIKIHDELYFELFIVIAGLFNTWFFVNGIPENYDELEEMDEYPKGLKIFTQYILLPLLGLYLLILYVYGAKILYLWDWPKGIFSYLIICISILGILTFLLLYPFGNFKENIWIKKAGKQFYFLLIPLLLILFIAIFMRIDDYEITIKRYVVLALGVWLTIVCIYTSLGKTNIKFVPISLAITLILTSFGPWGMFSVSEYYQVKRLHSILEKASILKNGKINNETIWIKDSLPDLFPTSELKNDKLLSDSLHNEVKSILDYLDDYHGFTKIRNWFTQDINQIVDYKTDGKKEKIRIDEASVYMRSMGLKYEYFPKEKNENESVTYQTNESDVVTDVSGYNYITDFDMWLNENKNSNKFKIDSTEFLFDIFNNEKTFIVITYDNENVKFDLNDMKQNLQNQFGSTGYYQIPKNKLVLVKSDLNYQYKILIQYLEMKKENGFNKISHIKGKLLIGRNKQ